MRSSVLLRVMIVVLVILLILAGWDTLGRPGWSVTNSPAFSGITAGVSPSPPLSVQLTLPATLTVAGTQWGVSTCYIGASEGSSRFNIADLQDLGITTYRLYAGMSRWEAQDDSLVYGLPTIEQIKQNPNVIDWAKWDKVMTNPPGGSDYSWVNAPPEWHGNARTLLSALNAAHIRIMLAFRSQDDQHNPAWAPNPPVTSADWNVWWGYVFATVYWLNVSNHYNVNDFEIGNEPYIKEQGWNGTEQQYFTFARYTYDAISYVYKTYLPGRIYHVYAPTTADGIWPYDALQQIPTTFDSMDIHYYGTDIRTNVERVHTWMNETGHGDRPLWLTEWGSYHNQYNSVPFGITLINNLIYGSSPGLDYVYGSDIFSLYDFGTSPSGLIRYDGVRRADYYALRLGIRALQGCRPTYRSVATVPVLQAITTKDAAGNFYLLVTNRDSKANYRVTVNLSALLLDAVGTVWQFDANHLDAMTGQQGLQDGMTIFTISANGALLIKFAHT